jgi:uncharacterized protein (DUF58 family)
MPRWLRPPRRLRFTREGRWFCGITLGIGIAAINTGNNLLYLILGMMLSLIVASGILSEIALRKLHIARLPPSRLHAGRPFLMGITLRNDKQRLPSFSIEIEDLVAGAPLDKKCYFLKLPAGKQQTTSYRHAFAQRGRYAFSGFRISTKFPFALFRKSRDLDVAGEVIVYPALHEVQPPPSSALAVQGELAALARGRRGEFAGVREYRPGDDPRDVSWRKSAQAGRPILKEFQDDVALRVTLQLDNGLPEGAGEPERLALERAISSCASLAADYLARGYTDNGLPESAGEPERLALERAISSCASLAADYLALGYTARLETRGEAIPHGAGAPQLGRILRCLALLPAVDPTTPFSRADAPRGLAREVGDVLRVARDRPPIAQPPAEEPR